MPFLSQKLQIGRQCTTQGYIQQKVIYRPKTTRCYPLGVRKYDALRWAVGYWGGITGLLLVERHNVPKVEAH